MNKEEEFNLSEKGKCFTSGEGFGYEEEIIRRIVKNQIRKGRYY